MDPGDNPYTPNAGARPPALVGRDPELESFAVMLQRLEKGRSEQSMLITGLRGVGKTVLLGEFRQRALDRDWVAIDAEIVSRLGFDQKISELVRRALLQLAPRSKWREHAQRAAGVLKSFQLTVSSEGSVTAVFNVEALEGFGDSGQLEDDLTDLLVALGEAAREYERGVVFLFDEVQLLEQTAFEALIVALHKTVQRSLPITIVGAGLPQLPRLAAEAKSYAERLFTFPVIGPLPHDEAMRGLVEPAAQLGVSYDDKAIDAIMEYTNGYPYFLQEYGMVVWDSAQKSPISHEDVKAAQELVEAKLDSSFFQVRMQRTTTLELKYLRAMAELGPAPQSAKAVAKVLGRSSDSLGAIRSRLIEKGVLYTPSHGQAAFTVPQFDRYLRRAVPKASD